MKLVTPNTTSRDQIIEKLRTFKNENAEKFGIESMALFGSVARGELLKLSINIKAVVFLDVKTRWQI